MSNVIWRKKPDAEGVIWNDLLDPTVKGKSAGYWVITYREHHSDWFVMWNANLSDNPNQLISKNIPEEQLQEQLKLHYLLTRGD